MLRATDRGRRRTPRPFTAARWLRNPHLQTVVPALLRRAPRVYRTRHRVELPDGDFLDVDVATPPGEPIGYCLIVHGLEGSSSSPYVLGTQDVAVRRGFYAVALNQRGCSGVPNRLPVSYHSGLTADIRAVLGWIHARRPALCGGVIGFSLGANQTLKLLGESGDDLPAHLAGAVAVSPPFDLHVVERRLESRVGAMYRYHFLRTLIPKALDKAKRFPDAIDRRRVLKASFSLRAFDDAVTARVHGYASADDYYTRASCGRYIEGVRRPTLVLTALDDPIIPGHQIPADRLAKVRAVDLVATRSGGHCGFVSGPARRPRFWAEQQAVLWLARQLGR